MPVSPNLSTFNRGELSPKLYSRTDTDIYFRGLRRCRNWIVENEGPVTFRSGTTFVAETNNNEPAFLYRFQFSDEQAYMLEFTDTTFRVFRNLGIVLSGPSTPLTVTTPYASADLFELKFAQNTQDLYVAQPNYNPQIITRTSDTNWTITPHNPTGLPSGTNLFPGAVAFYEQRLIYGGSNNNPETLFLSESANPNNFTIGTNQTDPLQITVTASDDANRIEWIRGTEDFLAIGGFGDLIRITAGQGREAIGPNPDNFPSAKPTNTFGSADINPISADEFIMFVDRNGRFLLTFQKDDITGIYTPVNRSELADHITVSGIKQISYQRGRPNVIWVLLNDGSLSGLTISKEQQVSAWHRHTTDGKFISIGTTPLGTDGYDTLWMCVERKINGLKRYYIEYLNVTPNYPLRDNFDRGNEEDDDLRYLRALAEVQKQGIHLDSAVTFDGSVRGINANADLTLSAATGTGVTVAASASVFASSDVGNQIWVKSISGERFGRLKITQFNSATEIEGNVILDFDSVDVLSAGEWYLTASELSGIDHLEGRVVGVVSDGGIHPDRTVTSGSISLESETSVAHVGLKYQGIVETMNLEAGSFIGTAQTKLKNVTYAGIKMLNTLGLKYGDNFYTAQRRLVRTAQNLMDTPPPLFTGEEQLEFFNTNRDRSKVGHALEKRIVIVQDLPLPAQIQGIIPYFELSDTI